MVEPDPKIQLSRLRDIGWSKWDPIGLRDSAGDGAIDEYDSYLLHVVSLIRNSRSESECVDYLVEIEVSHMGMCVSADTRQRAIDTIVAINEYISTLPGGPLRVR